MIYMWETWGTRFPQIIYDTTLGMA